MTFRKIALATAISLALVGCGADDQAYDYLDNKPADQVSISGITSNKAVAIDESNYADAYEIPLDGLWMLSQSLGDVTYTNNSAYPYSNNFIDGEKLVRLKFTEEGLVGDMLDGDVVFEGETSRFDLAHNNPKLFIIPGKYNAYECATDSYGDCTNKETTVSDTSIPWHKKTHFAPDFKNVKVTDAQYLFNNFTNDIKSKQVSYVDFQPETGVINIEITQDLLNSRGEPEKATMFYSLIRLDVVASKGYQAVHYDLDEHRKFGLFNTFYNKLNKNYLGNQQGYTGFLLHRFDPRKEKIEYHLSDEFFRKDSNGNLINQVWLDATVKGFEFINESLKDKFSPGGRLVPELVLVNKDETEPSGIKVGDIRKSTIHVVIEPSGTGLLGFGPSIVNPLTGEILSARTIMYPGTAAPYINSDWDDFVKLFNADELAEPLDAENQKTQQSSPGVFEVTGSNTELKSEIYRSDVNALRENVNVKATLSTPYDEISSKPEESLSFTDEKDRLEKMMSLNMYPVEMAGLSSSFVSEKTNIFDLDFVEEGMFVDPTLPEEERQLKMWDELNEAQQALITEAILVHQYQRALVHEIGHNLGLKHNFSGSFDQNNFYNKTRAKELGLKGVPATASIMDYTPSELDIHPAYGMYDRAALRFAYQRQVAVHQTVDKETQTREEILAITRSENMEFRSLAEADERKRQDLSNESALKELMRSHEFIDSDLQLKEYLFCSDDKGRDNLETGCRVFDEGVTIESITDNNIKSYYDNWSVYNERQNRAGFNGTRRSLIEFNYLNSLNSRMNMVIDDYYKAHGSNGQTPEEACSHVVTVADKEVCDATRAAYKQAYFYLDILKQPEMMCRVHMTQSIRLPGTSEYVKQAEFFSEWELLNLDRIASSIAGASYDVKSNKPKSCFDTAFVEALNSGSWKLNYLGNDLSIDFTVHGETKYGAFFNSFTSAGTVSPENASKYGYQVDSLGTWQEKLQAIQYLVEPSGLRGVDLALVDLPGVREELMTLIEHWALNKPLPAQTDIAKEFSQFDNPYLLVDQNGTPLEKQDYSMDWSAININPVPGFLSWYFNGWYGTNMGGTTPSTRAFLYTLAKWDSRFTDTYKPVSLEMRKYISLHEYDGYLPSDAEKLTVLDKDYYARPSNQLAYKAIQAIKDSSTYQITQYSRSELSASILEKVNLEASTLAAVSDKPEVILALKESKEAEQLKVLPRGMDLLVRELVVEFKARPTEYAELDHLNAALQTLFTSGDVIFDKLNNCFSLAEAGCVMLGDRSYPNSVINMVIATFDLLKASPELAELMPKYMSEYHKQVIDAGPIYSLPKEEVVAYLQSAIGHEAKLQKVINDTGLLNLVVISSDGEVTTF